MWDARAGKQRNGWPMTRWAKAFKRVAGANGIGTHDIPQNATSLGIAYLVIQHSSSPWFQQEAVALLRLNRLIYIYIG
jgi:hypothetical protein